MKTLSQPGTILWRGARAVAAALVLACVLLAAGQRWAARMPGEGGWAAFAMPVAPGRELDVNVWNRQRLYIDTSYNHSASTTVDGVMVGIWYQDTRLVHIRPIVITALPEWPLLAMAILLALFVAHPWWPLTNPLREAIR